MAIAAEQKTQLVSDYRIHEKDTGSPEVQIALLTQRINDLQSHFSTPQKGPLFASRAFEVGLVDEISC